MLTRRLKAVLKAADLLAKKIDGRQARLEGHTDCTAPQGAARWSHFMSFIIIDAKYSG
jgi:flagellar motor protein MotB